MTRSCSISGCTKTHVAKGLCRMHYIRFRKTGSVDPTRPYAEKGAPIQFVLDALNSTTDDCIRWPFAVRGPRRNYGCVVWRGKRQGPHRIVCFEAHGAPPTDQHEAAHSCGDSLCINPRHIRWATPLENSADKFRHGTVLRGTEIVQSKLTERDVRLIRKLRKSTTLESLASRFGVSITLISHISNGKAWRWVP